MKLGPVEPVDKKRKYTPVPQHVKDWFFQCYELQREARGWTKAHTVRRAQVLLPDILGETNADGKGTPPTRGEANTPH